MASKDSEKSAPARKDKDEGSPEWANGLRQLYDSVVEEPLPDSFKDLLDQFDDDGKGASSGGKSAA